VTVDRLEVIVPAFRKDFNDWDEELFREDHQGLQDLDWRAVDGDRPVNLLHFPQEVGVVLSEGISQLREGVTFLTFGRVGDGGKAEVDV
jgi:hypothetical protein